MRNLLISTLLLTWLLTGCTALEIAKSNSYKVGSAAAAGSPTETIAAFNTYFPDYAAIPHDPTVMSNAMGPYCAALSLLYQFNEHAKCLDAYGQLIGMPDPRYTFEHYTYYQFKALRQEDLGNYNLAAEYAHKALAANNKFSPILAWQVLGSYHGRNGEYDKAVEYIQKINAYESTALFGLYKPNQTLFSRLKREAITRVYIEIGDSTGAKAALAQPLAEKHISEYVMQGVVSAMQSYSASLESSSEKAVRKVFESVEGFDEDTSNAVDWDFYKRVNYMSMSAHISLNVGALKQSEKVYNMLLQEPNFIYQKNFYFTALRNLSEIKYRQKQYTQAQDYAEKAIDLLEGGIDNIADTNDKTHFIRRREDIFTLLSSIVQIQGDDAALIKRCSTITAKTGYSPKQCS